MPQKEARPVYPRQGFAVQAAPDEGIEELEIAGRPGDSSSASSSAATNPASESRPMSGSRLGPRSLGRVTPAKATGHAGHWTRSGSAVGARWTATLG